MKKSIHVVVVIALLLSMFTAQVYATSNSINSITPTLTRNIKINGRNSDGSFPVNPVVPGESPTTGLPSSNTTYTPILVQIDNNHAAIPQWGIASADIMYELPIQGQGHTRLTALFSDQYPVEAGPVRSGRVMHADLREEWDALIVHYGKQEDPGSDMRDALREYGVMKKGLAIDGIAKQYEKEYFARVKYHKAPHNVTVYVQKLLDLMLTQNYPFQPRPFKFTDGMNYSGVPALEFNIIHKGNKDSSSTFVYNQQLKAYLRYTQDGPYFDLLKPEVHLAYNNVIVQRTKLSWNKSSLAPLFNDVVGTGAADLFIGGQYIAGAWARNKMNQRTVFFDQNGNEISLQRGKTWIIMCDDTTEIILGESVDSSSFAPVLSEDALWSASTKSPAVKNEPQKSANQQITAKDTTKDTAVPSNADMATVKLDNNGLLNMRKAASKNSDVVSRIPNKTQVEVLSKDGDWTKIRYNGKNGYVMSSFLVFAEPVTVHASENIPAGATEPVVPAIKEYKTLKVGDSGEEVLALKKRFAELGYFRTDKFNDKYVDSTAEAVRRFERRNKLPVDGIADPEMQAVLFSDSAKGPK